MQIQRKSLLFYIFVLLVAPMASSQGVKFGKVSKEDLLEASYKNDSSVAAAVLFRKVRVKYSYMANDGFHINTFVHERIKIYDKSAFDYATVAESLYKNGGDKESMEGLKAFTYTLENGDLVKTKLKGADTFSRSVNKYYNEEKFTMPNVKEGCIIEYQYRIDSPFAYSIDEIELQYDIPIKEQLVSVEIPEYFSFAPHMKGYLTVIPKYENTSGKINYTTKRRSDDLAVQTSFSSNSIDYTIRSTHYRMLDVPALLEEPFVNDMDNYRSAVNFELQYVEFPQSLRKDFTTSWEKVIRTIYESSAFGPQLASKRYFKEDLAALISQAGGEAEKAALIFSYVQNRMSWNGFLGYYTDKGVKEAYKEKSGNTADINLMLVAMLREAGLNANPMLISTRDNGVPILPTRKGFNYVAAALQLGDNMIFLDASNKYTEPNILPTRALNWYGKVIKKDGSFATVSMFPSKVSKEASMLHVNMNMDGSIEGKVRNSYTDYNAYMFRNEYGNISEEDYLEKFENDHGGLEISDYEVKNKSARGKSITEEFDFYMEDQVEVVGDNIYFSPMFYQTLDENPFKLEERNYPIDFAYPWRKNFLMTFKIPEGYKVSFLPESTKLALPDNMGGFTFRIAEQNNTIQVMVDLKVNKAVIPATNYAAIKELYKKVIEKETEKVVLSKISTDGLTERTEGGR